MSRNILGKLRASVHYDAKSGTLTWAVRGAETFVPKAGKSTEAMAKAFNKQLAGRPAFSVKTVHGYLSGGFGGYRMYAHQVVWFFEHGEWPNGIIDHLNGIKTDNRPENLALGNSKDNLRNALRWSHNKSGENGVYSHKNKWRAAVMIDQKSVHLGTFSTFEEAKAARSAANILVGFSQRHGSIG